MLVTARHVLYGHQFDEDPFTKHIVFSGRLRELFELRSEGVLQELKMQRFADLCTRIRRVLRRIRVVSNQELENCIMAAMDAFNRDPVAHTLVLQARPGPMI